MASSGDRAKPTGTPARAMAAVPAGPQHAGMSTRMSRARWLVAGAAALALHLLWWPAIPSDRPANHRPPVTALRIRTQPLRVAEAGTAPAPAPAPTAGAARPPHAPAHRSAHHRPHDAASAASQAQAQAPVRFERPDDATLDYLWTRGNQTQAMRLTWTTRGGTYTVCLETASGPPSQGLHRLRSDGRWSPTAGLAPQRYTVRQPGRSERAVTFLEDEDGRQQAAFSATTFRLAIDPMTQDELSWLPHWLGLLRAGIAANPVEIAAPEGQVLRFTFVQDTADPLHWIGTASPQAPERLDLWLRQDGSRWPQRWRRTPPWGAPSEWSLVHHDEAPTVTADP